MIGSLRGEVLERNLDGTVLLEVAGIGYIVTVSQRAIPELEPGSAAFLLIHHHIREDAQTLFGFTSKEDKATFQVLLATHGVGPAMAMSVSLVVILSSVTHVAIGIFARRAVVTLISKKSSSHSMTWLTQVHSRSNGKILAWIVFMVEPRPAILRVA